MFRKQFRGSLVVVAFCAVGIFGTGCSGVTEALEDPVLPGDPVVPAPRVRVEHSLMAGAFFGSKPWQVALMEQVLVGTTDIRTDGTASDHEWIWVADIDSEKLGSTEALVASVNGQEILVALAVTHGEADGFLVVSRTLTNNVRRIDSLFETIAAVAAEQEEDHIHTDQDGHFPIGLTRETIGAEPVEVVIHAQPTHTTVYEPAGTELVALAVAHELSHGELENLWDSLKSPYDEA